MNTLSDPDRILAAHLRLRADVTFTRHVYRGQTWHVLGDSIGSVHLRCNPVTADLLTRLDGSRPLSDVIDEVARVHDTTLPPGDVLKAVATLAEADLLIGDSAPTPQHIAQRRQQISDRRWLARLARPLFVQVPLLNPAVLLTALARPGQWLFSPSFNWITLSLVVVAVTVAAAHTDGLATHFDTRFTDPLNLVSMWLLYPVIKLVHELAHGLTCRRHGGEVREMGVMLLVLMPVPYVDASSSAAFANKWARLQVAAAGIVVELQLAAVGMLLWWLLEPGLARDLAFNVTLVASVSTLLFNGNPLLRFDGYYVLADLIEIPALARRSREYLGYLLRRYVLGFRGTTSPAIAPGERGWLAGYGVAAGTYRLFISLAIALLVANTFPIPGLLLAAWFLTIGLLLPWARSVVQLLQTGAAEARLLRTVSTLVLLPALPLVVLFAVPVRNYTWADGVIVVPEDAIVRTVAPGFAQSVPPDGDTQVRAGQVLMDLQNQELELNARLLAARETAALARYSGLLTVDRMAATDARQQAATLAAELADVRGQLSSMRVVAQRDGTFVSHLGPDSLGRWLDKGTAVGHVAGTAGALARVVVPERQIGERERTDVNVRVRLAALPQRELAAVLRGYVPQSTLTLPARSLGTAGGGSLAVDMRDNSGLTATEPLFVFDIRLPADTHNFRIGQRVHARFEHGGQPLGWRLLAAIRHLLPASMGVG